MMNQTIANLEAKYLRPQRYSFEIGDTVDVHVKILEGDKERTQVFSGIVISMRGSGTREYFTVRRIVEGEGVERKFPFHSPKIADVVVKRRAKVRRAKLYFLRDRIGKQAFRLKERPMPAAENTEKKPRKRKGRKTAPVAADVTVAATKPKKEKKKKKKPAAKGQ